MSYSMLCYVEPNVLLGRIRIARENSSLRAIIEFIDVYHESELLWAQLKFSFTNSLSFDSLSVRVGENEALVPYY